MNLVLDNYNAYGWNIDESLILGTASVVKNIGLRDVGYYYIILDDTWSDGRSSNSSLIPDATKFPNGMFYLGDTLHAEGFGFGIYSDAGNYTVSSILPTSLS